MCPCFSNSDLNPSRPWSGTSGPQNKMEDPDEEEVKTQKIGGGTVKGNETWGRCKEKMQM